VKMSTLKQIMERIETLRAKRELIDAVKEWVNKSFTGNTSISGRVITAEIIDEMLVDIDSALTAAVDEELMTLESMEVQNGKGAKGSEGRSKPAKARSSRAGKASS